MVEEKEEGEGREDEGYFNQIRCNNLQDTGSTKLLEIHLLDSAEQDPMASNQDMISSLPVEIISIILEKLNIVDSVRTSLLSRNWRYKWLSSSELYLDSRDIGFALFHRYRGCDVLARIFNHYLLHHTDAIKVLSLKADFNELYPEMYQWFNFLSERVVENLLVQNLSRTYFIMPSYLFSFKKLISLSLTNCALRVPSTFGGFDLLDYIFLLNVSISGVDLAYLILRCPVLTYLSLGNISGLKNLRIEAPNLTYLRVDSGFEDIVIGAVPNLSKFIIADALGEPIFNWQSVNSCLSNLDSLESLELSGDLIKMLAANHGLENFPLRNDSVKYLSLNTLRFDNIEVFRVCLSLLTSCLNTECFCISFKASKGANMSAAFFRENRGRFLFPKVKSMTVTCPSEAGMGCATNFIEFVISHCPNLMFLTILKKGIEGLNAERLSNMMQRFRKRRPDALISYKLDGILLDL